MAAADGVSQGRGGRALIPKLLILLPTGVSLYSVIPTATAEMTPATTTHTPHRVADATVWRCQPPH